MKIILLIVIIFTVTGAGIFILLNNDRIIKNESNESINDSLTVSQHTGNPDSFIEKIRNTEFKKGEIKTEQILSQSSDYTSSTFSYSSDGLKIFGRMNVPSGDGPFPVIILNHGYFNQSTFQSGDGTQTIADILVRNGYLTLASDYRGHGKSENDEHGSRGHNPNYSIDVLNLIAAVDSISVADSDRIGMWGHSMGGEVSLRVVEATNEIKALVLWAPTSGRSSDNAAFYGGSRSRVNDDGGISPIEYLRYIETPISLHQGLSDTEVDPEWSKELNEELKREGKEVEYFEYEGQDHNFRNLGWNIISTRTIEFYDKYLN